MEQKKLNKLVQTEFSKLQRLIYSVEDNYEQIGLYRGISSSILFTSVLCKIYNKAEYQKRLLSLVKKSTHLLDSISYDVSFSSGLSGWAWTLNYVKKT